MSIDEKEPFRLESNSEWDYDHSIGEVLVPPRRLKKVFGKPVPNPGEPEKCTGEYIFIARSGKRYSVHDWRDTNRTEGNDAPSPRKFWNISEPYALSLGVDELFDEIEVEQFKDWLTNKLR